MNRNTLKLIILLFYLSFFTGNFLFAQSDSSSGYLRVRGIYSPVSMKTSPKIYSAPGILISASDDNAEIGTGLIFDTRIYDDVVYSMGGMRRQDYRYSNVWIPIFLDYYFSLSKVRPYISFSFLLSTSREASYPTTIIGFGVAYKLSPQIKIHLEPYYWFSSNYGVFVGASFDLVKLNKSEKRK